MSKQLLLRCLVVATLSAFMFAGCDEPVEEPDNDDEVVDNNDDNENNDGNDESVDGERFGTEYQDIRVSEVAGPFENPWAVEFLPDGRKLVTERPGRLQLVEDGDSTEVDGLPELTAQNQGGLLDVRLHPDYEDNGWIYLTYSKPEDDGSDTATAVARAQLDDDEMELTDLEDVYVQERYSGPGRHYGSRMGWLSDGTLLVSIGDRGAEPPRAQDTQDSAGSVIRIEEDGEIPGDNPFVDDDDVLDEIYTYGNRNIQGMVVDEETDDVWATNHGPRGGDELYPIEAGNNYGWPVVTQGLNYGDQGPFPDFEARSMDGVEEPFHEFFPTMAPSGLALVTTDRFDHWEGNLLAGGLRGERIRRIVVHDDRILDEGEYEVLHQEELLLQEIGRIRDVREGPDGDIWVLTDAGDGSLYRIEPA